MDKSREPFQSWWEEWFGEAPLTPWNELWCGDGYSAEDIDHMWEAWQASRAAVEIELDAKVMVEDEFDKGHNCAIDYCAEAIRASGLRVKGE
ncbi:hypothetical protein ROM10_18270 [Cronobacter sakazakii]|uniref:hypothetical protein n=1 Tax=Cronobacter sakazakii TaxID=28141 RepID=UPI002895BCCA|nr:hypothetical protein [Cronobacter sakazakii]MDT3611990.1 hypothetical protein [Cronobacter sakazakii]